jgi:hypothetical protein
MHSTLTAPARVAMLRCVSAHLDPAQNLKAWEGIEDRLADTFALDKWSEVHVDVAIRLAEHGLRAPKISEHEARELLDNYAAKRPDFVSRIQILIKG